jgi:hypothetical protein
VQYQAGDINPTDQQIKPQFKVTNIGKTSVPLSELTIRYWYTVDGDLPQMYSCDYAMVGNGNVTGKFVKLSPPQGGADYYLEVGFKAGAGALAAGSNTGEIQNRINKSDFTNYDESNDYSFDPTKTAFADWMRVTLYDNGGLVWGTEPGCADPGDGAICSAGGSPADASDAATNADSGDASR